MPTPLTSITEVTQTFDGSQASNLLHKAIAQQVQVQIEAEGDQQTLIVLGELSACEDARLTIRLKITDEAEGERLPQNDLKVFFEISGNRYVFETETMPLGEDDDATVMYVEKPDTICLVERRRAVRRRLRQPTVVHLTSDESGDDWSGRATMLNASEHGLACRIVVQDATPLTQGRVLQVEFRLGGESDPFKMKAKIVNMTDGGSEDHVVLGMEFTEGYEFDMERDRLRNALRIST